MPIHPRSCLLPLLAAPALAQLPSVPLVARTAPRATWTAVTSAGVSTGATSGTPTVNATFRADNPGAASFDTLWVFGGSLGNNTATTTNDLWAFDAVAGTFTQRLADGAAGSPSARGRAAVAWNPVTSRLVLFGGDSRGAAPALLGDTWEYDPATNAWAQQNPAQSPSARRWSAMAFDPALGGMLLFGGETVIPPSTTPPTPPTYSNETWLWLGGNWTQLSPATAPLARSLHSLVTRTDAFQDVLLCGGSNNSTLNTNNVLEQVRCLDVWRWTGVTWQLLSDFDVLTNTGSSFPAASIGNQAVYDPIRSRLVLQGGNGHTNANNTTYNYGTLYGGSPSNYTSEFDSFTNSWTIYANPTTGTTPFNNSDPVLGRVSRYFGGFVAATGKVYKACGQDPTRTGSRPTYNLYAYQAPTLATATSYGTGCTGAGGPLQLVANATPWTGRSAQLTASGFAATSLAVAVYGFTAQATPLAALTPVGVPGCDLLASPDATVLLLPTGGSAIVAVGLPNDPTLSGLVLNTQVLQLELSPAFALSGLSSTNGIALQVGAL